MKKVMRYDGRIPWRVWVKKYFPRATSAPFAERHVRLWEWFEALADDAKPRPRVEVWPRGGAKSSSGEMGVVRVGCKLVRRFCLYVSGTQDQANKHVQSIGAKLEDVGMERLIGSYGHSKGWKVDLLRCANGFNVLALGLDAAARGVKLDDYRPDLIIFDDIDNRHDKPQTVQKKIETMTESILPSGSTNCAVLFLQNKIHINSIVSQMCDGTADFLLDREPAAVEPAVHNLEYKTIQQSDGTWKYQIVGGEATWEGQNLQICERQLNEWGKAAFLREAQQMVEHNESSLFRKEWFHDKGVRTVPEHAVRVRRWDMAATEDGDWTVGILMAKSGGQYFIEDVVRFRKRPGARDKTIRAVAQKDHDTYGYNVYTIGPQDPGSAGIDSALSFRTNLDGFAVKTVRETGDKQTRAEPFSSACEVGNVYYKIADWNKDFFDELCIFPEDGVHDDQVDAVSGAYNELSQMQVWEVV